MVTYNNQIRFLKFATLYNCTIELILEELKDIKWIWHNKKNQDPIHASLALSSLLSVWYKPNSLNNKSIYNTLLLEFYISAKPRLTHWYPCPKKSAITFAQGCIPCHISKFASSMYSKRWVDGIDIDLQTVDSKARDLG